MASPSQITLHDRRVLDGGLATELERRGFDIAGHLWSARLLLDAPEAIEAVHYDYYVAGADVAITCSYQASYDGFAALGLDDEHTTRLLRKSVELADAARRRYRTAHPESARQLLVAASVGPYGAVLHDGSEYHGRYDLSERALEDFHRRRLAVLADAAPDLLACETIPSLAEARAILDALHQRPAARAWMSFTSRDGVHTAAGDSIADCARLLDAEPQIVAVGINCVAPEHVTPLTRALAAHTVKPIVVYPNSGEQWNGSTHRWESAGPHDRLGHLVPEWISAGASWIGGCCRTTPDDVSDIHKALAASGRSSL